MKHSVRLVTLILIFLSTMNALAYPARKIREGFKEFKIVYGGVAFSVDPRTELYQAVVLASGMPVTNYVDIDYKVKVDINISKYKLHPLFSFAERNLKTGRLFKYIDDPIWFLLHLTNNFEWRKDVTYEKRKDIYIDSFRYYLKKYNL